MNALATAIAHALANASSAGSVGAKGREGTAPHRTGPNGVFSGWSPSTTSSSYVEAATRDDVVIESETIEGIDLDADVPCTGQGCIDGDHPADYIIGFVWPHGHLYRGARCNTWWKSDVRLRCIHCEVAAEDRDDVAHIVEVLR